VPATMGDSAIT